MFVYLFSLDLDKWINEPDSESEEEPEEMFKDSFFGGVADKHRKLFDEDEPKSKKVKKGGSKKGKGKKGKRSGFEEEDDEGGYGRDLDYDSDQMREVLNYKYYVYFQQMHNFITSKEQAKKRKTGFFFFLHLHQNAVDLSQYIEFVFVCCYPLIIHLPKVLPHTE